MTAVLQCACSAAADAVEHYEGDAYAIGDGRLLYRESHWLYEEAGAASRIVLYRCPDGTPFARKRLRVGAMPQAPDFEMSDARSGYIEGVRSHAAAREVFMRPGKDASEHSAALPTPAGTVIDAGFDAFVRTHWSTLAGGASMPLSFVVPSRLAALPFKVRRIDDTRAATDATLHLRLQLASWYGALLPHIDVFYDDATHELRRYEGVSNVRDAKSNNVEVRIEFPPGQHRAAHMQDVDAAAAAPLTGTCGLS
ncbi:MAG TPA: hypothetical protein VGC55_03540 [Dokdonella sp.]